MVTKTDCELKEINNYAVSHKRLLLKIPRFCLEGPYFVLVWWQTDEKKILLIWTDCKLFNYRNH